MANHTNGHPADVNNYVISRTWDEVMKTLPTSGEAEAAFLPVMQAATNPETAIFGEAAGNGAGMEPFNYTVEGRDGSARPPARNKRKSRGTRNG